MTVPSNAIRYTGQLASVFVGYTSTDEYGHRDELVGVSLSKATIEKMVEGKGWWGSAGPIERAYALIMPASTDPDSKQMALLLGNYPDPFPLDVNLIDEDKKRTDAARKKLLEVMSPDELRLLGIQSIGLGE